MLDAKKKILKEKFEKERQHYTLVQSAQEVVLIIFIIALIFAPQYIENSYAKVFNLVMNTVLILFSGGFVYYFRTIRKNLRSEMNEMLKQRNDIVFGYYEKSIAFLKKLRAVLSIVLGLLYLLTIIFNLLLILV